MELIDLVKGAQTGDSEAQGALYEKTYQRVYYLALRLTGNPEDAQDAAQEAFISAFRALPNLREPNAFEGWLFQITANKCRNRMTRGHNDEELPEGFEEHEPDPQEDLIPEDALQSAEKRRLILQIINNLPDLQRECVMLFYYSEFSVKQIAETMECSEGTVKSRLNYARQKIKEGILETEKRDNIRLHTFVPFSLFLAKDFVRSMAGVTTAAVGGTAAVATTGGAAGTSTAGTAAGTVKTGLLATAKAKVIAGVTAAAITVGGGAAVVSQMPKAIAFSDPAMEQNIRVLVDKPEGRLYADDLDGLFSIYVFEDGMACMGAGEGSREMTSAPGTVPVDSLTELSKLPNLLQILYCAEDPGLLCTLGESKSLRSIMALQTTGIAMDFSFLDGLSNLRQLEVQVPPGSDLSPIERRTSLQALVLSSAGPLHLQADKLQDLRSLSMHTNLDGLTEGNSNELMLTQELPQLRDLSIIGGVTPTLDILNFTPALLLLGIYSENWDHLDLAPIGGLQHVRAISLIGNYDATFDLAPLASCSALEVYSVPNGQLLNPPPRAMTDTESNLPNYNRVAREVKSEISATLYEDVLPPMT